MGIFSTFKKIPEHHSKNFPNINTGNFSTFEKFPEHHSIMACQPHACRAGRSGGGRGGHGSRFPKIKEPSSLP
jgi:hypothetical protein